MLDASVNTLPTTKPLKELRPEINVRVEVSSSEASTTALVGFLISKGSLFLWAITFASQDVLPAPFKFV